MPRQKQLLPVFKIPGEETMEIYLKNTIKHLLKLEKLNPPLRSLLSWASSLFVLEKVMQTKIKIEKILGGNQTHIKGTTPSQVHPGAHAHRHSNKVKRFSPFFCVLIMESKIKNSKKGISLRATKYATSSSILQKGPKDMGLAFGENSLNLLLESSFKKINF